MNINLFINMNVEQYVFILYFKYISPAKIDKWYLEQMYLLCYDFIVLIISEF